MIFVPFRALGYISNHIPSCIQQRGQTFAITTCIGSSFQIYDGEKFNLLFVGSTTPEPISFIACHKDTTFVACGHEILLYVRGKQVSALTPPDLSKDQESEILQLLVFGDLLLALYSDNCIRIWNHVSKEFYNVLGFNSTFHATRMIHPSTYLNKMLIASQQGTMQLWNIKSVKMIFEFPSFSSPITTLCQAPSIDIIAIGLLDGSIIIYDIKSNEELMRFKQQGRVSAISFRTDGESSLMASCSNNGDIALWNLESKSLFHVVKGAHDSNIHTCSFYTGQPLLLTVSSDNSIKMWIFDSLDGIPRLLKSRSGHYKPPHKIQFYGSDGKRILSCGRDQSLRMFSLIRDAQNVELSQGSLERKAKDWQVEIAELKFPLILDFASCETRAKEWDNILTCHLQSNQAKTWSMKRKSIGVHTLESRDGSMIKSTAISSCGHFGFIGTCNGTIDKYNLQSGLFRGSFKSHTKAVVGISSDNLNSLVISASLDKTIKFWDFEKCVLLDSITFETCVDLMVHHKESNLLAIATDDLCIRVVDVDTRKIIREFWGHESSVIDLCFSPDGRWVVSCARDSCIMTWDLPSSHRIDCFQVPYIPTSLTFSPNSDFLVTTHVDQVGLFIWANRTLYENVSYSLDKHVMSLLPTVIGQESPTDEKALQEPQYMEIEKQENIQDYQEIQDGLITLSSLSKTKWHNLLHLESIKKRNKPQEPPKAPEKAPFFLTTLPGVDPKFIKDSLPTEEESKILRLNDLNTKTKFSKLLGKGHEHGYLEFLEYCKTLSPSALDFEIRSLSLEEDFIEFYYFLQALKENLIHGKDFELMSVYLNVFTRIYGDVLVNMDMNNEQEAKVMHLLKELKEICQDQWNVLQELLDYSLCLIEYTRVSL